MLTKWVDARLERLGVAIAQGIFDKFNEVFAEALDAYNEALKPIVYNIAQ